MTAITLLLTFVITLIIIFATLIYQFEAGEWTEDAAAPGWGTFNRADGRPSPFLSIFHSFYWVLVTMTTVSSHAPLPTPLTTVGCGDMRPCSLACLRTCLLACVRAHLRAYVLACLRTCSLACVRAHLLAYVLTCVRTC